MAAAVAGHPVPAAETSYVRTPTSPPTATEALRASGFEIDTSQAVVSNDPSEIYEEYDMLRARCPVAWVNKHNGYWMLTRYEDINAAAKDSSTYISSVHAVVPSDPRGIRRPPLTFDAPAHTPYRTALDRTLKPARLKRLENILSEHATRELRVLTQRGEGNICTEFAGVYSAWVETEWLNLDSEIAPLLADNAREWVGAWRTQDWDKVKKYSDGFYDIARDLLRARRAEPRNAEEDPASSLLLERGPDGKPLEEFHLIGCLRQSLVVAMIAPTILIGNVSKHLSYDKELQNKLRADPSLVPAAVEEFVRLYTPYRSFSRTVATPQTIAGQTVAPGEPIALTYTAANRDPTQFPDPTAFILNRENIASHLGFGKGRHRCAGVNLARLAMAVFIRTLLEQTTDFEISGELEFARMPEMGIISCPMKFVAS
ncbi:putative cytochrome P450 [Trichodelitschia bisporula]|uniref:Putative cytochrome P450 n=1 Tax=Trichodelitschia bisporula TaxID=703511 RepID=A0A6G1HHZ9_9PEZI|nr:putative cytochrome P450 [Trichodelitschia bisporula]